VSGNLPALRSPRVDWAFERLYGDRGADDDKVARELMEKFGCTRAEAYRDVRAVWEDLHDLTGITTKGRVAKLTRRLELELAELAGPLGDSETVSTRAKAVTTVAMGIARINGCLPESRRAIALAYRTIAITRAGEARNEAQRAAMLSIEEIQHGMIEEERRMAIGVGDDDLYEMVAQRFGADMADALRSTAQRVGIDASTAIDAAESPDSFAADDESASDTDPDDED